VLVVVEVEQGKKDTGGKKKDTDIRETSFDLRFVRK